jgi:hypothetical protein
MKKAEPITIRLGDLTIIGGPPDYKLTPEQETAIEQWWQRKINRIVARELGCVLGLPDMDKKQRW